MRLNLKDKAQIYMEFNTDGNFTYAELYNPNGEGVYFDADDLSKIIGKKPVPQAWGEEYKKCPYCFTPLIYDFEYCPKCGQCIDYKERTN